MLDQNPLIDSLANTLRSLVSALDHDIFTDAPEYAETVALARATLTEAKSLIYSLDNHGASYDRG